MKASASFPHAVLDVFLAPGAAFQALRERAWGWPAFALICAVSMLAVWLFFSGMSPEWIVEQQMAQVQTDSAAEEQQVRTAMESVAEHTALLSTVFTPVMFALITLLFAGIYAMGGRFVGSERYAYGKWMRLTVWTQFPTLLNSIGLIVLTLLASTPNQPLNLANYASLNNLLLGWPPLHAGYAWAEAVNLFYLWSALLAAVGIRNWTGAGMAASAAVGVLPYALVFGVWGLLVLL